jgi:two-component system sensor histidine kinase ChvG
LTPNSTTSKPSTESDTATKKSRWFRLGRQNADGPYFDDLLDLYWGGPERRITGLTLRIIGVNAAALLMLAVGTLYLGHYQKSLIEAKLDTFKTEVELVSSAFSEMPTGFHTNPTGENARIVKRLSQTMDQRIYLFNASGDMVVDSAELPMLDEPGHVDEEEQRRKPLYSVSILKKMAGMIIQFLPERQVLPGYPESADKHASTHPDAADAVRGIVSLSAWHDDEGHIFLTAAAPMYRGGNLLGAVMLARGGQDIEEDIGLVWMNILKVFFITLFITILLSIYLSGTIANPLRRLASAAESLRKGKEAEIPDFSYRRDEIGELSIVLREMTQALWDRMDSIERFAADVAHELKNPLTSLKSAVETASIVKKDKDRAKLMEIIAHDIERMDRLISDISNASRLDAELSRASFEHIDLRKTLNNLIDAYKSPLDRTPAVKGASRKVKATAADVMIALNDMGDEESFVWGLETRLAQVFENLVSNAISFSPPGGTVHITIVPVKKRVVVTVEDEGPGIPENRLETVFDRFYTERPEHEDYGRHSGLGLSICKQIVTALGGQIFAENIKDERQKVTGARFTVILGRA